LTTVSRNVVAGGVALIAVLVLATPGPNANAIPATGGFDARSESPQELPPGVTQERITMGGQLFQSEGCVTCHGADGKGKPGMTSDLTDGAWKFAGEGGFETLAKTVQEGLTSDKTGGMPMPAASTRDLTDEQVNALAAYVWSLNQKGG